MIHHGSHAFWRKTTWFGASGMLGRAAPPPGALSWESWRFFFGIEGARGARGPATCTPCGPTLALGGAPPSRLNSPPALPAAPCCSPSSSRPSSSSGGASAAAFMACASSPVRVCTVRRFSSGRPIHFWRGGRTSICDVPVWPAGTSSVCGLKATFSSLSGSSWSSATVIGALAVFLTATS